ncbi:MAG: hypothetical protein R3248_15435, partial [Candidatus Promineifilaceae bacterium]|nr:hypothetical protein [Candidatus Promineifilaceae bacterium]
MMIRIWKLNLLIALLTLLLLAGCLETEQTVPFDPGAFETSSPDEAVVITVAGDSFVQGEPVPYTITNRSARPVYYPARGPACEWPAAGVDTFLYTGDTESGWKRVRMSALDVEVSEEEPAVGELAAGETVECSWEQTAHQELELEGEERFRDGLGELAPVPPGYYQFHF